MSHELEGICPGCGKGGRLRCSRARNFLEASLLGLWGRLVCRCVRCGRRSYLAKSRVRPRRPDPERPPLADSEVVGFQDLVARLSEAEAVAEATRPRPRASAWMGAGQY